MTKTTRFAVRYEDGSFNVSTESKDLDRAKHLLNFKADEDEKMVRVEISVVQEYGTPELKVVEAEYECSHCGNGGHGR